VVGELNEKEKEIRRMLKLETDIQGKQTRQPMQIDLDRVVFTN
jgi:hypothetical protein